MQAQRFASPATLARWAVRLLFVMIVVDVVTILSDGSEISLLSKDAISYAELDRADTRDSVIALVSLVAWLLTAGLFIGWFARVYRNLDPLGARELRYSRGWAIGAWFVPILNLIRPIEMARDVWRASDPGAPVDQGGSWRSAAVPQLFAVWWSTLLVSGIVSRIAGALARSADGAAALRTARTIDIVATIVEIAAAWAAVQVVRTTTARQEQRAALIARPA